MTTETTTTTIIDLPEITDEMVERATKTYVGVGHYADPGMRAVLTEFRAELLAGVTRWEPIERDQIRIGMRIRATVVWGDRTDTGSGVAHHTDEDGDWLTEGGVLLTSHWGNSTIYEVDSATVADPADALIEALREASWRIEPHMGGRPDPLPGLPEARDLLNKLRELGWTVIRESEATA